MRLFLILRDSSDDVIVRFQTRDRKKNRPAHALRDLGSTFLILPVSDHLNESFSHRSTIAHSAGTIEVFLSITTYATSITRTNRNNEILRLLVRQPQNFLGEVLLDRKMTAAVYAVAPAKTATSAAKTADRQAQKRDAAHARRLSAHNDQISALHARASTMSLKELFEARNRDY
jgi:hypothetical protein